MRARAWTDLIVVNLLVLVLVIAILLFPSNVIRIILGIPFVLFFPGYISIAALFPRKASIDNVQRVALSFGMSIAVALLIGLILNYFKTIIGKPELQKSTFPEGIIPRAYIRVSRTVKEITRDSEYFVPKPAVSGHVSGTATG